MLKNLGSVWFRTLVTIGVLFISKPFIAGELGLEANDRWVELNNLVGWLALVAAGVPMSTTRQVARRRSHDDHEGLERTVASSMAIYLALGAAAAALGALLYPLYAHFLLDPGEVAEALRLETSVGYALLVLFGAITFSAQLHYGIFNGHQDFVRPNLLMTGSLVFKLLLFLVILPLWPSVTACCAIALFVVIAEWFVGRRTVRARMPRLRLQLSAARRDEIKEIAHFSAYALLLNLGIKLSFMTNLLVIGATREVTGESTLYEAASTPIMYLMEPVIAVGYVMLPKVATWKEKGELSELRESFLRWAKICTMLGLLPLAWLIVQAGPFLHRWMRDSVVEEAQQKALAAGAASVDRSEILRLDALVADAGFTMMVLALGTVLFLPARGLAMPLLMGLGKTRAPAFLFVAAGVLNVILAAILVPEHGLFGAAAATAIATTSLGVALMLVTLRELNLPIARSLVYVFVRPLIAATLTAGLIHWLFAGTIGQSWTSLVISGAVACASYAILLGTIAIRGDDRLPVDRLPGPLARWLR